MSGNRKGSISLTALIVVGVFIVALMIFGTLVGKIPLINSLVQIKGEAVLHLESIEGGSASYAFLQTKAGNRSFMESFSVLASDAFGRTRTRKPRTPSGIRWKPRWSAYPGSPGKTITSR